jgi:hypothetical protein
LFQNPVGFGQALGKTGQKPGFSLKSKEAVPKAEVLEQPHVINGIGGERFLSPSMPFLLRRLYGTCGPFP